MLRERRLRRSADFAAVYRSGRSASSELLALRSLKTARPVSRVGFAVGRRLGTAVVRNRVKRRLRAAMTSLALAPGWDIVVTARPAAATKGYHELEAALAGLLRRQQLLRRPDEVASTAAETPPEPLPSQKQT
jgi:ribonuclease P protein component